MVWPAPNQIPVVDPNVVIPSSLEPHRRLSIGRLHRIASPLPLRASSNSPSSNSPSSQKDWQHQRQQQWLDRIPYESPPPPSPQQLPSSSLLDYSQQTSSSSLPSTAIPPPFTTMPGSYYSDLDPDSPSSEEEDMFRLAHSASPSWQSTIPRSSYISPTSSQEPQVHPFSLIPSAQPRSSFPSSSSPPPFTNMSYSTQATQAASSLPSPPSSQHERPESPLSVADSQPTLRQGAPQVFSPSMSPTRRPPNRVSGRYAAQNSEDVDNQALNAVVDGIGRMQVNMNLDQAGRWRIARRTGAPW